MQKYSRYVPEPINPIFMLVVFLEHKLVSVSSLECAPHCVLIDGKRAIEIAPFLEFSILVEPKIKVIISSRIALNLRNVYVAYFDFVDSCAHFFMTI